jgi:bromodomain-containing factor 1
MDSRRDAATNGSPSKDALPLSETNGDNNNTAAFLANGESTSHRDTETHPPLSSLTSTDAHHQPEPPSSSLVDTTPVPPVIEQPIPDLRDEAAAASLEHPSRPNETAEAMNQDLSKKSQQSEDVAMTSPMDILGADASQPPISDEAMEVIEDAPPADGQSQAHSTTQSVKLETSASRLENAAEPAPSSPKPTTSAGPEDTEMADAPSSTTKVSRERDEDEQSEGPAAKRTKTEGDASAAPEFKVPDASAAGPTQRAPLSVQTSNLSSNSAAPPTASSSVPITKAQFKFMLHGIRSLKKMNVATAFIHPVDPVALNIPTYYEIVKQPMDIKAMEAKLKEEKYNSVDEYKADFALMVRNAELFNGLDHPVTKSAQQLQESFLKQMANLPKADAAEPTAAEKKAKKAAATPTPRATAARRESRQQTAQSTNAGSPQFALPASGIPIIRRESTVGEGGRPKREIHPPAPRDLPYLSSKPKKKKFQWELKFCQEVVNELNKPKHGGIGYPFYNPVDPVALKIPHYHKVIKKPMDLGTISSNLKNGQYENAKEFESDIRLMFQNCYKFNPVNDPVHQMGKEFERVFDKKWEEKNQWIKDHAPPSGPTSPVTSDHEESEEEEEEEEDEDSELAKLKMQLAVTQKMVEAMEKRKEKTTPPVAGKKGSKAKNSSSKKPGRKSGGASQSSATKKDRKSSLSKTSKPSRPPHQVTYEEKRWISEKINALPDDKMNEALIIIKRNMPKLGVRTFIP